MLNLLLAVVIIGFLANYIPLQILVLLDKYHLSEDDMNFFEICNKMLPMPAINSQGYFCCY